MKEIRLCDNGDFNEVFELCQKYDLGIEVQTFAEPVIPNLGIFGVNSKSELIDKYSQVLKQTSKGKSLHAPFKSYDLANQDPDIQAIYFKRLNEAYAIAKRLGCTEMVVHSGYETNGPWVNGWLNRATLFLKEFLKDKDNSITIMIENQKEENCEILKKLIDCVNDPRVKVCLDIGHINANCPRLTEDNWKIETWIKELGNRIGYLHLSNNEGPKKENPFLYMNDTHGALGEGNIPIEKVFELIDIYCPEAICNVEVKTENLPNHLNG